MTKFNTKKGGQFQPDCLVSLVRIAWSISTGFYSNFGKFSYIHKLKNGKNIFYFANSNDESINTEVLIKGKLKLQKWNPHNGEIDKNIDMTYLSIGSVDYTKIKLSLKGVDSIFFIE